ncbi:DUF3906 family protein [Chengkuizengella axinellae]|uniref:DUF3906 family protein n=1 Tax=Chengkuizengella axinellae TaxID=3064388 RepID=A0ABT9IZH7_9BACL|nr:DUF3906 family protein [Chengkuizengella sp. 2205SS18-9]MDP5274532.1 DUF3906 family protein [Chengkuizengella sp. 2205SS18-9]
MFLYKLEIQLKDQIIYLVVIAESDEKAFDYAESSVAVHFVKMPEVLESCIVEKKRLTKGSGYVIETNITD